MMKQSNLPGGAAIMIGLGFGLAGVFPIASHAQMDSPLFAPMQKETEINLGLGIGYLPEYLGSDKHEAKALPFLNARWKNGFFAGTASGFGYNFAPNQPLQFGLQINVDRGRDQDDSDYLRDTGDIKARAVYGGFVSYSLMPGSGLTAAIKYGSGNDRKGLELTAGGNFGIPLSGNQRIGISLTGTYVNQEYMQEYFGVSQFQSASSGYSIYSPVAGMRDVQLGVNYLHQFSPQLSMNADVRAYQLLGDAKDSPLTRSSNGVTGMLGIGYRF
jgi:outer membrane scaffolding protein for murein synthesis (MipA/OmpV family)